MPNGRREEPVAGSGGVLFGKERRRRYPCDAGRENDAELSTLLQCEAELRPRHLIVTWDPSMSNHVPFLRNLVQNPKVRVVGMERGTRMAENVA